MGNLKGREKWDDLKPHGEERWKKNPGKRGGPAGQKSGAQRIHTYTYILYLFIHGKIFS